MQINLNELVAEHLQRVKQLADDAADDDEQGFQSRASAMSALTTVLQQITKTQESLITMERLQKTEQVIIDCVKDFLTDEQLTHLLEELERRLTRIQ